MMLELHYKDHESECATSGLIRQWAAKWGATRESVRLRPITGDDFAYTTGQMSEFDEVLDYVTRPKADSILHHIFEFDCGVPDDQPHPAKKEMWMISNLISATRGKVAAAVQGLKDAGYSVDETEIASLIDKHTETQAAYERLIEA